MTFPDNSPFRARRVIDITVEPHEQLAEVHLVTFRQTHDDDDTHPSIRHRRAHPQRTAQAP